MQIDKLLNPELRQEVVTFMNRLGAYTEIGIGPEHRRKFDAQASLPVNTKAEFFQSYYFGVMATLGTTQGRKAMEQLMAVLIGLMAGEKQEQIESVICNPEVISLWSADNTGAAASAQAATTISGLQMRVQELETANGGLKKTLQDKLGAFVELEAKLAEVNVERTGLLATVAGLRTDLAAKETAITDLDHRASAKVVELQQKVQQAESAYNDLTQMVNPSGTAIAIVPKAAAEVTALQERIRTLTSAHDTLTVAYEELKKTADQEIDQARAGLKIAIEGRHVIATLSLTDPKPETKMGWRNLKMVSDELAKQQKLQGVSSWGAYFGILHTMMAQSFDLLCVSAIDSVLDTAAKASANEILAGLK